jgi:hypothetical protein
MAQGIALKNNFIYGEVDPIVENRADYPALINHLRESHDVYPTESGALFSRGGSEFFINLKDALGSQYNRFLIYEFDYTKYIKYLLVFYNNRLSIYNLQTRDWCRAAPTPTSAIIVINTPYAEADLFLPRGIRALKFKNIGSVIYVFHDKYPTGKISYYSAQNWTYSPIAFSNGPWAEFNSNKQLKIKVLNNLTQGQVHLQSTTDNPSAVIGFSPYHLSATESITQIVWQAAAQQPITIVNPADRSINMQMLANYLTQNSADLTAIGSDSSQTITAFQNQNAYAGANITCAISVFDSESGQTALYNASGQFTAMGAGLDIFTSDMVGRYIQLKAIDQQIKGWSMDVGGWNTGDICKSGENYYKSLGGNSQSGFQQPKHTEGSVSDGKVMWQYLHSGYGRALITQFVSAKEVVAQVLDTLPDNLNSYKWRLSLIDGKTYPVHGDFIDGRFSFGYNSFEGPAWCASQPDDFENFNDFNFGVIDSESAIKLPLYEDLSRILWIKKIGGFIFSGSIGGLTRIGMVENGPVSLTNVQSNQLIKNGANEIPSCDLDGNAAYVSNSGMELYLVQYNFQNDDFSKNDILKMNKYQFRHKVVDIFYVDSPYKAICARLANGEIKQIFINLSEQTKGVFTTKLSGGEIVDACASYDDEGLAGAIMYLDAEANLLREYYRYYYDDEKIYMDYEQPCAVEADDTGDFLKTITLPARIFDARGFAYNDKYYLLPSGGVSGGAVVDVSELKISHVAGAECKTGRPVDWYASFVPKFSDNDFGDGGQVLKIVFRIFKTKNFAFGEVGGREREMKEWLSKQEKEDGIDRTGEFSCEWDGLAHKRGTGDAVKQLRNGPEIFVKNSGVDNFCIGSLLLLTDRGNML